MKIVSEHTAHQILFKQLYIDECLSEMLQSMYVLWVLYTWHNLMSMKTTLILSFYNSILTKRYMITLCIGQDIASKAEALCILTNARRVVTRIHL